MVESQDVRTEGLWTTYSPREKHSPARNTCIGLLHEREEMTFTLNYYIIGFIYYSILYHTNAYITYTHMHRHILLTATHTLSFFLLMKYSCCTILYKLQVYNIVIHNFIAIINVIFHL